MPSCGFRLKTQGGSESPGERAGDRLSCLKNSAGTLKSRTSYSCDSRGQTADRASVIPATVGGDTRVQYQRWDVMGECAQGSRCAPSRGRGRGLCSHRERKGVQKSGSYTASETLL